MTAFVGLRLPDGVFLAADSRRTKFPSGELLPSVVKLGPLTPQILIATGGLGTLGHEARDELRAELQSGELPLSAVISRAQIIFDRKLKQSYARFGYHPLPLTCLLGGRSSEGTGFFCSLSSKYGFQPF